jgi:hypothetical protein
LPGRGVASIGSLNYLVGNPTRKRLEAATAYTGKRWAPLKKKHFIVSRLIITDKNSYCFYTKKSKLIDYLISPYVFIYLLITRLT